MYDNISHSLGRVIGNQKWGLAKGGFRPNLRTKRETREVDLRMKYEWKMCFCWRCQTCSELANNVYIYIYICIVYMYMCMYIYIYAVYIYIYILCIFYTIAKRLEYRACSPLAQKGGNLERAQTRQPRPVIWYPGISKFMIQSNRRRTNLKVKR